MTDRVGLRYMYGFDNIHPRLKRVLTYIYEHLNVTDVIKFAIDYEFKRCLAWKGWREVKPENLAGLILLAFRFMPIM